MTWDELQKKQSDQWREYFISCGKSLQELEDKHRELEEAFFDLGEEMPLILRERIRIEQEAWQEEWGAQKGIKIAELKARHKKEIEDLRKVERFKEYLDDLNDKESYRGLEREL